MSLNHINMNYFSSTDASVGYLELIFGSMFSGKTSRLVEIYKQCKMCNISVTAINHSIDERYESDATGSQMSTHDRIMIPCIKTENLLDVWTDTIDMDSTFVGRERDMHKIRSCSVVLINEGQFFPDLVDFVKRLLRDGKKVYVCGLDGDFETKKFGHMVDLIPLCDKVYKLTSLCSICKNGTKGIFSMRLTCETGQTLVGSDNYASVCRMCYDQRYNNVSNL